MQRRSALAATWAMVLATQPMARAQTSPLPASPPTPAAPAAATTTAPVPAAPAGVQAANAVDVAGVRYAPTVLVAGNNLVLNGAGVRYRFVIRVYTAGLYLTARAATPEAVYGAAGPRRLHVVMLRDIDANELGKLFTRGMQDNAPKEAFSRSIPGTLRMADIFSAKKKLVAGENFSVDWVPGSGTVVLINGKPQGEPVREPEFFNALLSIWLGPKPADDQLKEALLGQEPRSRGSRGR